MEEVAKSAYAHYELEQREIEATEQRFEIVEKLLEKLPESERTVVTLHYLGEMTTKEISKFLGVSVEAIRTSTPSRPKTVTGRRGTLGPRSAWWRADIIEYKAEHHATSC